MKLNNETIKLINLFEMLTGARVKDCFDYNEKILFIVNHGDIRKVVAKHPQALELDVEKTMKPRVEYLRSIGVKDENIGKVVAKHP